MRIVVTGSAGFLGSHVCDRLVREGHTVLGVDNLITGDIDNIGHLMDHQNFQFLRHDVTVHIGVEGHVDAILHLASPASPADYLRYPIHTLMVGSTGTHKTLRVARDKSAKFLLASSSEVYGDPLVNPQSEAYWGNVNAIGARSVYDEAKRFAEAITMAYHRYCGLDTAIARIFNTYGPRMRPYDGRVVPTLIVQALKGEPLTVYGDGSQTRSFCYVSDMVEGIYKLLLSDVHEPVNLGNPEEVTILDLAKEIIELTGSKSEICFKPLPENDPQVRCPDIARARELLNWKPRVCRREGIKEVLRYYRNELGINREGTNKRVCQLKVDEPNPYWGNEAPGGSRR